jgi:parvulin-like peptidyl-prolyl isomerase
MMHKMRENTRIILWVVVVAFVVTIFAVWGLDLQTGEPGMDPTVMGTVNGVPITRPQYQSFYEMLASQFRAASNEPLTFSQEEFIASQAWDNLIYTVLTDQQIEKLGITVTNEEIVSYLRATPPPEIRQYFLDDQGNFDDESYQTALNNPEIDWTNLEMLARERIPRLKLQNYLAAKVFVSDAEVERAYETENLEMTIAYVEFPIDDTELDNFTPTEQEIQEYYNSHQDEFIDPAKARIDVVRFELTANAADADDARFTVDRVRDQLLAGEDFGALAKTYSEAPTANVDGNTGFLKRGQREDPYFDALDGLAEGEISESIPATDGYYVLKLIEKKDEDGETKYNVQEILVKTTMSRQTVDSLYTVANELRDRAAEVGLDVAVSEKEYTMLTPEPFTEGAPIGTLGFVPNLSRFAFSNEVGALSSLIRDENNVYVARVVDKIPESVRPLADVAESIRLRLVFEARKDATLRKARAFHQKVATGSFEEAVETYGLTAKEPDPFKATDNLEGLGPNSIVAVAALETPPGETCPPVEWRRSFIVVHVLNKSELDRSDFQARAEQIRDMLETQKIQTYTAFWYEKLKEESVIEDFRGKVY